MFESIKIPLKVAFFSVLRSDQDKPVRYRTGPVVVSVSGLEERKLDEAEAEHRSPSVSNFQMSKFVANDH